MARALGRSFLKWCPWKNRSETIKQIIGIKHASKIGITISERFPLLLNLDITMMIKLIVSETSR